MQTYPLTERDIHRTTYGPVRQSFLTQAVSVFGYQCSVNNVKIAMDFALIIILKILSCWLNSPIT